MQKKTILFTIKLCVTVGLFTLLFRPATFWLRADLFGGVTPRAMWHELSEIETHSIAFWLAFAALVKLAGMLCGVLRWRLLLHGQGLKIPFWYMVQSWFVGRAIGIYLPGTLGLDGYRLYDSARYTGDAIKCTTVIAVEKLIGFIALTLLVFVTFPLGFHLLKIKVGVLAVILSILGCFVLVSFTALLNPRVIQVLVALLPTPAGLRRKLDRLGAAITAYSGNRRALVLACLLGVGVHLGTCFMYFGTMMAIRAANTSLIDILFASPLMIYATVIGPSVGGEGIREIVFVYLLSAKTSAAASATLAHLGWWVGEFVPFLIGVPILLRRRRPQRAEVQDELRKASVSAGEFRQVVHLTAEAVQDYRAKLLSYVGAAAAAGLVAGAVVGLAEAKWLIGQHEGLVEGGVLCWGPLVYGIIFAGATVGAAGVLAFMSLVLDRFLSPGRAFALLFGATMSIGALGIGGFRYWRDVLDKHSPTLQQLAAMLGTSLGIGLASALAALLIAVLFKQRRILASAAVLLAYVGIISLGGWWARTGQNQAEPVPFATNVKSRGPNIIFIGVDTLRADYLNLYSSSALPKTPSLDRFAQDAILFKQCFSQAGWTKPSFATMFTGRYPSSHTATSQTAVLPDSITTLAEALHTAGYYTQGYSNNGNIARAWNFQQGFVNYIDLEPDRYFGAPPSAVNMTLYQILRKVRSRVIHKKVVTEFYQPAEVITHTALDWVDGGGRPAATPFYLFLHYMDPHDPYMDHSQPGIGYARAEMENPDPEKYADLFRAAYVGEIEYLDQWLGALFDGLRQRGLYDNTVIVLTGDHGEEFYEHRGWWHGQTLYDEVTHVPLILKLAGNAQGGLSTEAFARHIDLAPTLLRLAGAPAVPEMQGLALAPDPAAAPNPATPFVYSEEDFEGNVLHAVRTKTDKLIRANADNPRKLAPVELYDLVADPGEQKNVAGAAKPAETVLGTTIDHMRAFIQGTAAEPVIQQDVPDDLKDRLNAIGYN